ncbi:MAG TPA: HAD family phosphatase, partial [Burkholderiaceae bacterium]|nr:HAD family phosphatase [Burkholderiaceae bacterium]
MSTFAPTGGPIRAFIFDMDGTMVDSMGHHALSWAEFLRRHGLQLDMVDVMRMTTGRTGVECMRLLLSSPDLPEAQARAFVHEKEAIYRESFSNHFTEVEGFTRFYEEALSNGMRVAVGTAGDAVNVDFVLTRLALSAAPGAIARGDEGLAGKPEPDIFLAAAARLNVDPRECVVFEDAPLGIEAARRAGMRAVGICSSHTPQELDGPHVLACVDNYHQIDRQWFWTASP